MTKKVANGPSASAPAAIAALAAPTMTGAWVLADDHPYRERYR